MEELEINQEIIRKGIIKETYIVKQKKLVNNILHYIIKSSSSGDVILSKFAIEKDFVTKKQIAKNSEKKKFMTSFKNRILSFLPINNKFK